MAELIWQSAEPNAEGIVAEYRAGGGTVKIMAPEKPRAGSAIEAWTRMGQHLAAERIREYLRETGQLPSEELLERFQRVMAERVEAFIRDPMGHKYTPMTLRAFEMEYEDETL